MPYRQQAERVLALWRAVERQLEATAQGSPEAEQLQAEAARLRDEYQHLIAEAENSKTFADATSG
jgi:chemotaxis regulatin CheY-phosphate phosphatase CheZ